MSLVLSGGASAAPIGLTTSDGNLVTIDLADGASDPIGPLGSVESIVSLEAAPDGTLFGLQVSEPTVRRLITINPSTGAATVIGDVGSQNATGLAFDGAGRLFVADGATLFEVDPGTAMTAMALDMGTGVRALASSDGDLYAIRSAPVSGCELVLLETDLGMVTQVLPDVPCVNTADGHDGSLWLVDDFSPIMGIVIVVSYRLELATGVIEQAGTWGGDISALFIAPRSLAAVGKPSLLPVTDIPALDGAALAVFALALAAAAVALHRRRASDVS